MSTGLYQLGEFKDNCGFGMIAHTEGKISHGLLTSAIEALTCMTHRGGIAADGKTGDGCGLLMQKPDGFLRLVAAEAGLPELSPNYGIGSVMLSRDPVKASVAREAFGEALVAEGLVVAGWREVPTDSSCLGPIALETLPSFYQVFVNAECSLPALNARLFMARRHIEKKMAQDPDFYVASLSSSVLSYKGLMMPVDVPTFYPDLADPRLETAICVFHQRFSTNTMPRWKLAQPFRMLAHNGEINTITGNRNWSVARTSKFQSELLPNLKDVTPLVNSEGSDSSSLDNMLEVLVTGGMPLHQALRMLVPPAWNNAENMDPEERAFYEYNTMHVEPWDGPAGLVVTDGRYAVCTLDRNGLRPSRWVRTKDGLITVASEVGVHGYKPEDVIAKGRLGPGDMLSVDTDTGELLFSEGITERLKSRQPYKEWLKKGALKIEAVLGKEDYDVGLPRDEVRAHMKMFLVSIEERDQILRPLAELGQEAVGSMGDDTPMAVLSRKQRNLFDYFRQQFAQVTNPPIDPLREAIVMSLRTQLGRERNVFVQTSEHAKRINLRSPVLSPRKYYALRKLDNPDYQSQVFSLQYDPELQGLKQALEALCDAVEVAVRAGTVICFLTDDLIEPGKLPIHSLLATGAIHHHLTEAGLRCDSNIIVETGYARDPHQIATLLGYGASAVYPYLSYQVLSDLIASGELLVERDAAFKKYRTGINKGLKKILSKMGISTISSYRGSQLFEAIGLADEVVDLCFKGTPCRIKGADFNDLEADQKILSGS